MFGFFKKRSAAPPTTDELRQLSLAALDEVKAKWLHFDATVHLVEGAPLAEKIDVFAAPLAQLFQSKYPALLLGGSKMFWLTIFTAILESGTHPKDTVNEAIEVLRAKYAGR